MAVLKQAACALAICLGILLLWCPDGWSDGVLVLKSRDVGPFRQAAEGLTTVLDSAGVRVHEYMHGSEGEREALEQTITASDYEVVVAVGTVATEEVLVLGLDIPVVFCMVLDPVGRGFVLDLDQPGGSVTGVALDIPIDAQFEALRETVPGVKRVGVLYSTARNRELVGEALAVADRLGLRLVPAEITSEEAVPRVLRALTNDIDALWGIADPVTFSNVSTEHVILHTIRNSVPFMGLSASFVKAGALLALSCDYYDVGSQAGEIVLQVLEGRSPGDIAVAFPRATALHLSLRTARLIGKEIPDGVVAKAKEVRR